jgi:hypothetical protein
MSRSWNAIAWTTLTMVGLAGGLAAGLLLGRPLEAIVGMMLVTPIVTGLVGCVLGLSQVVYLRSSLERAILWVVATCLGLAIGLAGGVILIEQAGTAILGHRPHLFQLSPSVRALCLMALGLIAGAVLGLAQRLVLRRSRLRVTHWASLSAIALGTAFGISSLVVDAMNGGFGSTAGAITFVVLASAVYGAVSSIPLRSAA